MMRKRINQTDIANKLGLSQRAVSKALNGEKDISERTRQLVLDAAKELRYRKNRLARSLIDGKSRIIGVVMIRGQGLYFYNLWQQIEDEIVAAGYTPLMLRGGYDEKTDEGVFQLLLQYQAEGLIVLPRTDDWRNDFFEDYLRDNGKVVFIGKSNVKNGCNVYNDDYRGARVGINYLLELGHRKIAYVGPVKRGISYNRMRYSGYIDELSAHGIEINKNYLIDNKENNYFRELIIKSLKFLPEVTAVFCHDDKMALKVFHACSEVGFKVPEDLSIMGFSNNFHYPDDLCMPLSTVGHNARLVGKTAVKRIIGMIEGEKVKMDSPIENKLIIRKSTGKPKK